MVRGSDKRLGLLDDPSLLNPVRVTMIDISNVSNANATTHFKAGTSPAILSFLGQLQSSGIDLLVSHKPGLMSNSVALVQSGVNIALKPLQ
jgi:esterase/lipase superfamily enzyme